MIGGEQRFEQLFVCSWRVILGLRLACGAFGLEKGILPADVLTDAHRGRERL